MAGSEPRELALTAEVLAHLPDITARLIRDGAAPDAAAACIASASLSEQRVVRATLGTLSATANAAGLGNLATVVVETSSTGLMTC